MERLQIALRYELAANGLNCNLYLGGLHSAYVRGEAFVGRRPICGSSRRISKDPRSSRYRRRGSHRRSGAFASWAKRWRSSGDKAKAKTAYQDFLSLWKDADPDVPILKQAKAEYDGLR